MKRQISIVIVLCALLSIPPATAGAELLQAYVNGHGSMLGGDGNRLSYFAPDTNNGGPGFGFTIGGEVMYVDLFLDANFQPTGSQWNQIGIGFDIDLIPIDLVFVEPTAQLVYFFGKQADGSEGVKGLFPRAGVQAGLEFAKVLYAGVEGYGGYVLSTPEPEAGFAYIAGIYVGARIGIF